MNLDNFDKAAFNVKFDHYINLTDFREANKYYTDNLHKDIQAIIIFSTIHFAFACDSERQDVHSDLLYHFLINRPKMNKYKGNWYNIVFTILRNRFYDICKAKLARERRRDSLANLMLTGSPRLNVGIKYPNQ